MIWCWDSRAKGCLRTRLSRLNPDRSQALSPPMALARPRCCGGWRATFAWDMQAAVCLTTARIPSLRPFEQKSFYMPGDGSLLNPQLSGRDHLLTVARLWKSSTDIAQAIAQCSMEPYIELPVRHLSQGMAQQLALACAYVAQPKYLLLDEPMNALDPTHAESNGHYLRALARRGSAVLFSSHILDNVTAVCDSVLTMERRRLTEHQNTRSRGFAGELYRRIYQTVNDAPGSAASRLPPR